MGDLWLDWLPAIGGFLAVLTATEVAFTFLRTAVEDAGEGVSE
jgi:hypothetical protein